MASLLGINTDRVIALTFVIGAAMAAVAGVLGQFYGVINPYIGFMAGMKAFTAAVLGGSAVYRRDDRRPDPGIAEALSSAYLSTEYKDVVSFALLILVLLVMPTGILGRPEVEKYETDANCNGAALCRDVLHSGGRLYGRAAGAERHQTGGRYRRRYSLAVDLHRYRGGLFFQLLRPLFQKAVKNVSGPKFIMPAIDGSTVKQKLFLIALLVIAVAPFMVSRGTVDIATLTMIYIILGLGLNVVVGLSGLLVLGYGGFYAIGAYTFALLNHYYGLGFWTCLPLAGSVSAAAGFLLGFPVLRLRGDYRRL